LSVELYREWIELYEWFIGFIYKNNDFSSLHAFLSPNSRQLQGNFMERLAYLLLACGGSRVVLSYFFNQCTLPLILSALLEQSFLNG
jgi:hypothetical protein